VEVILLITTKGAKSGASILTIWASSLTNSTATEQAPSLLEIVPDPAKPPGNTTKPSGNTTTPKPPPDLTIVTFGGGFGLWILIAILAACGIGLAMIYMRRSRESLARMEPPKLDSPAIDEPGAGTWSADPGVAALPAGPDDLNPPLLPEGTPPEEPDLPPEWPPSR